MSTIKDVILGSQREGGGILDLDVLPSRDCIILGNGVGQSRIQFKAGEMGSGNWSIGLPQVEDKAMPHHLNSKSESNLNA